MIEAEGAVPRMTEEELLRAIGDALTLTRRRWHHVRRSDLARVMGTQGLPDVLAIVGDTLHAWELKTEDGRPTPEQIGWLRGFRGVRSIDAQIIRPEDLDTVLDQLLRGRT